MPCTYERYTGARSRNRYTGKAVSIAYFGMRAALLIQHATRMNHITL